MNMHETKQVMVRRKLLLAELRTLGDVIAGSFFEREVLGIRRFCLSRMQGKRQRQTYIAAEHRDTVQYGVQRYRRALELLSELGEVNLQLLKQGKELADD